MVSTEQMNRMKQLSLAETGFLPKAGKQTRKAVFLAEMEAVVPWSRLEALIEPFYPKKGNGRPPMPLGTMLRIHFMQQWFGYSDPAMEEALHDVPLLRPLRSAGLLAGDAMGWLQGWLVGGAMGYRGDVPALCRKVAA